MKCWLNSKKNPRNRRTKTDKKTRLLVTAGMQTMFASQLSGMDVTVIPYDETGEEKAYAANPDGIPQNRKERRRG